MATEPLPEMPDLRRLRLAYAKAIVESEAAEDTVAAAHEAGVPAPSMDNFRLSRDLAHQDEIEAGRAFLAALQLEDPACTGCGCTMYDPCADEDGDTCGWASTDPFVCTFCASGRQREAVATS